MIRNLEHYIKRYDLIVNVEEIKMFAFARGNKKEYEWKWERGELSRNAIK